MGLHIVVCIKITRSTANASYDPKKGGGGGLKEARAAINPLDQYAIEEAKQLIQRAGGDGTISVLSVGNTEAEEPLKEAVARGCHQLYLLNDPAFTGSDPYRTSEILSKGIEKLSQEKPVNLVICGKQSNDSDSGQVGQSLAAWMNVPSTAFVKKVIDVSSEKITVERSMEDGTDVIEMILPAVISVVKEINEPGIIPLKGKMAAKKAKAHTWTAQDLGISPDKTGEKGSLLQRGTPTPYPPRAGGEKIQGNSPQEKAKNLLVKLRERSLI